MNITFTGRHMTISDNLKDYAEKKISKLEDYFNQILDAHIIMYVEKINHGAEVIINGDGVQFHGREKSDDLYATIDMLFDKMEKQVKKYKEKHSSHKVVNINKLAPFSVVDDRGLEIRLNQVSNKPIDRLEAYLQMKNDNADFILFKQGVSAVESELDYSNKNYAVIYKTNENDIKMVEIPFEQIKDSKSVEIAFVEYKLNIISDSLQDLNIEFSKNEHCSIKELNINDALEELKNSGQSYMPFFNIESQYFNVIFLTGKEYEVIVPAY